ncbi:MAG: DUF4911 domain-containing protein [Syntrophotaleaceae bacterium]
MSGLSKRYFRLPTRQIGYLRFILESYDGLAYVTTLDAAGGLVEIVYPSSRGTDADGLIDALVAELGMVERENPF